MAKRLPRIGINQIWVSRSCQLQVGIEGLRNSDWHNPAARWLHLASRTGSIAPRNNCPSSWTFGHILGLKRCVVPQLQHEGIKAKPKQRRCPDCLKSGGSTTDTLQSSWPHQWQHSAMHVSAGMSKTAVSKGQSKPLQRVPQENGVVCLRDRWQRHRTSLRRSERGFWREPWGAQSHLGWPPTGLHSIAWPRFRRPRSPWLLQAFHRA